MKILAIETSCDETAVAVADGDGGVSGGKLAILGNALYSQAAKHAEYGGVYPVLAKREHQGNLAPLAEDALRQAGMLDTPSGGIAPAAGAAEALSKIRDEAFRKNVETFLTKVAKPGIDYIAVTDGPGLEPALWTGINFAEALSAAWDVPVIGIDHMEGHIISALLRKDAGGFSLPEIRLPLLALLISGGHTELVLMKEWFAYQHVGRTKDDALGEAFDKVARLLDLEYPGGPKIEEYAARSRERGGTEIVFPRPLQHESACDFSFSGLKTAVLYKLRGMDEISEWDKEEIAQAFEDAARDSVVSKTRRALRETGAETLAVGGGVSANAEIRNSLAAMAREEFPDAAISFPAPDMTGDNAVMIAGAAWLRIASGAKGGAGLVAEGSRTLA